MAGRALDEPKKVKSRPYDPGLALRRRLLIAAGFPAAIVEAKDATLVVPRPLI